MDAELIRRFAAAMQVSEPHARSMIRETAGAEGTEALVRKVTERIESVERRRSATAAGRTGR